MTIEELKKVPFRCVSHLAMENEHCMTYISEDGKLGFCDRQPYKNGHPKGKGCRHWRIDEEVFETQKEFLAALADFSPKVIPIGKR